jgi:hypothetical protein
MHFVWENGWKPLTRVHGRIKEKSTVPVGIIARPDSLFSRKKETGF